MEYEEKKENWATPTFKLKLFSLLVIFLFKLELEDTLYEKDM